jgi:galactokinase
LSTTAAEIGGVARVTVPHELLYPRGEALEYTSAHQLLTSDAQQAWAAYVVGVLVVLQRELNLVLPQGVRMMVHCEVPIGKGVSSSAALEVATMQAVCALVGKKLDGPTLAILCQKVENFVVGAPCGLMDQMTSACGEQDCLLALLCQPAELLAPVRLPEQVEVWGIDSGVRHAVTGSDYAGVRIGAFMGYRILAEHAEMMVTPYGEQYVEVRDPLWRGYLANITPSLWETSYCDVVPVYIGGQEFLERYHGSTDVVTRIDPERVYAVRQPTAHPIYEHHRTQLFKTLLQSPSLNEEQLLLLGELMYQSHASYSACGLGSARTDRLVAMVRAAGPATGLYGAMWRITSRR